MTLWIVVALLAAAVAAGALWWRRHRAVADADALARRPTLPPSPYGVAKGFKMLVGDEDPEAEPPVAAPRLSGEGELIFGDLAAPSTSPFTPMVDADERRALARSARRTPEFLWPHRRRRRWALAAVLVVLVVAAAAWSLA